MKDEPKERSRLVPANRERHPLGCPDPDWCSGNGVCYWCCDGSDIDDAEMYRDDEPDNERNLGLLNPITAPRRIGL